MINSMSYKGYTTSMVFDAQDKIIVGRILDVDDIISFHAESVAEFESNFHSVIEGYLAALKAAARSGTSLNKWAEGALGKAARKPPARAAARSDA